LLFERRRVTYNDNRNLLMPLSGASLSIKQLDVELNGGCNYKCEMCPQAFGRERDFLKKLPTPLLEKILDDAAAYGVESVSLHGSGEPTLNPDMPDIVRAVKARGFKCVSFTNGFKLNEQLARRLIEAGIDVLRISAIGYDAESYHRWMSRDVFEQVRENVRRFVGLNRELGRNSQVHLYHLVTDINERDAQVEAYKRNWIEYTGALAEVWLMHNWVMRTAVCAGAASPGRRARRSQGSRGRLLHGLGQGLACRARPSRHADHPRSGRR
jgi:organic radical activating enzyme